MTREEMKKLYPAEGAIDECGDLSILRPNGHRWVNCKNITARYCGEWCPQFGNPDYSTGNNQIIIETCCNTLYFDKFTDERNGFKFDNEVKNENH